MDSGADGRHRCQGYCIHRNRIREAPENQQQKNCACREYQRSKDPCAEEAPSSTVRSISQEYVIATTEPLPSELHAALRQTEKDRQAPEAGVCKHVTEQKAAPPFRRLSSSSSTEFRSLESFDGGPFRRTQKRDYRFFEPLLPIRRVNTYQPLIERMSSSSQLLMDRLTSKVPQEIYAKPTTIVRDAQPNKPDASKPARKRNRFQKQGVRRIDAVVCRPVAERLMTPIHRGPTWQRPRKRKLEPAT